MKLYQKCSFTAEAQRRRENRYWLSIPCVFAVIKKYTLLKQSRLDDFVSWTELTLQEKISKIENLKFIAEKREQLVGTRLELEKFTTSSNNFNCFMLLNDSDGSVFTTRFTPGIKKVIVFLKTSFDASITEAENKITFWFFIIIKILAYRLRPVLFFLVVNDFRSKLNTLKGNQQRILLFKWWRCVNYINYCRNIITHSLLTIFNFASKQRKYPEWVNYADVGET